MLRTPLLPRDDLERWGAGLATTAAGDDLDQLTAAVAEDREVLRTRLQQLVARPEVREAIFVASPVLEESIDAWIADPTSEAGQKTERSLVRYVSRMAVRPTPFGLFAGNTIGALGETTHLELAPRAGYRRYTRIDGDYLSNLTDALGTDRAVREQLLYRPNSSLCLVAGRLRYAMRREGASRSYSLVSLEPSDYLVATLERARAGALTSTLAEALVDADAEVTREEADEFISELIDSQVLVSELAPPVTGPEAVDDVLAQLTPLDAPSARATADALAQIRGSLQHLDRGVGNPPATYRQAAQALAQLPVVPEISRLFQVNLVPAAAHVELGRDVIDEVLRATDLFRRLARPRGADDVSRFRDAFLERYEGREVPLAEVLDEESGIGFAASQAPAAAASPLLDGLPFPGGSPDETTAWGARVQLLARKIAQANVEGALEIVLDDDDLAIMDAGEPAPPPDAFQAMFTLARSDGDIRIQMTGLSGPPGSSLLGRFCHSDPAMHETVTANLTAEEALRPDAVFAEVVHLADGRLANISARPVLRQHEIVYLGRSGAPQDRQLPITDLMVSVREGRIVLRSRSLDREVIPRLTNAHNYVHGALGPYRFLASVQGQDARAYVFHMGPLTSLPFVPRIRVGKLMLREASWMLSKMDLDPINAAKTSAARMQALHRLRQARRLPRWVCVEDGDNVLPVDLDNTLAVDSFAQLVKQRGGVSLTELWPPPAELAVTGPDGHYTNELVIPFVRVADKPRTARSAAPVPAPAGFRRTYAPGSEWLYAKLYTGSATADQILDAIAPLVAEVPRWFFIRYADPHWHVRFRMHGAPAWLYGEVLPRLAELTRPMLDDGRMWRFQLDTYEREVERYGGPVGIELSEQLFWADSACVVDLLGMLAGDAGIDARWRLTLRGLDQILEDLGFDLPTKLTLMRQVRDGFAREHRVDANVLFQRVLGDKYRKEKPALDALLDRSRDADSELAPGFERFARRSADHAPVIAELRAAEQRNALTSSLLDLAPSYLHMHANRLIRSAQRAHELVLYDLLVRLYESQTARAKQRAKS